MEKSKIESRPAQRKNVRKTMTLETRKNGRLVSLETQRHPTRKGNSDSGGRGRGLLTLKKGRKLIES